MGLSFTNTLLYILHLSLFTCSGSQWAAGTWVCPVYTLHHILSLHLQCTGNHLKQQKRKIISIFNITKLTIITSYITHDTELATDHIWSMVHGHNSIFGTGLEYWEFSQGGVAYMILVIQGSRGVIGVNNMILGNIGMQRGKSGWLIHVYITHGIRWMIGDSR